MILIDTHAHLYLEEFDTDREDMVRRAIGKGVQTMLLPHIDSRTTGAMFDLCALFPENCLPMMGLHPTSVKENYKEELAYVSEYLKKGSFCAIGEIGIDLYWDTTFYQQQVEALRFQFDLALQYNLPVAIHARKSLDEIFLVMEDYKNSGLKGVFHCFPGNTAEAERVISYGFYLGIGGVLTYKNSGLKQVIEDVGLDHVVLETDAPFLSPAPKRGMRNESAFVYHVAEKIAETKNLSLHEVAEITTRNALNLFHLNTFTP